MFQFCSKRYFKRLSYLILFFFIPTLQVIVAQTAANELTKYSHTQFIEKIISTKDSVFSLKNAFIYFDTKKDSAFFYEYIDDSYVFPSMDTLTISVQIELENVHFEHRYDDSGAAFHHMKFTKPVLVLNTASLVFSDCVFEQGIIIDVDTPLNSYIDYFELDAENYGNDISINNSKLKGKVAIGIGTIETFSALFVTISNSVIIKEVNKETSFSVNNIRAFDFTYNRLKGDGIVDFSIDKSRETMVLYNDFDDATVLLYQAGIDEASVNVFDQNIFNKPVILEVENFSKTDTYRWNEWEQHIISYQGYSEYIRTLYLARALNSASIEDLFNNDSIINTYKEKYKFQLENAYKYEKRLLGTFYDFYKSQYDSDFSNATYVKLKDLDTQRYQYLNEQNPSFKTYFTWKINQFLKFFSAYGTAPSESIIISIYVIFIFAFFYMFFPNSWDTMSKNRLTKRIRFYTRYFRNNESMKEIYAEERKKDLMNYDEFKDYMQTSQKEIPSYFLWLAKPLYYFSSSNYKIISKLFDKTDILKGKWVDLPKNKRIQASVFMGLWIIVLIIFDVFIKFINALTLSINTFTTLGFGEIPTKGIPRYLTIIQGFIGWFMLSIFSVSLISQLLN
tara:strand:- start:13659 stop:15518 length:1860 start_codon:yes stop_codon:yes gene_type:complete